METLIIDKEFKELLPPLDEKTYKSLEANIIANGCMFPLVTWQNILIDGHNRHAICTEHEIAYKTIEKDFAARDDVIIWIINNQVSRRNLTAMQLSYFRGLHYNTVKQKWGATPGNSRAAKQTSKNQMSVFEPTTAKKLSNHYKVSQDTIFNDAKTSKAIDAIGKVSPEAKAKILAGDVPIDKKELKQLASAPEDEIAAVAEDIEKGVYEKPKPENPVNMFNKDTSYISETGNISGPDFHGVQYPLTIQADNPVIKILTGTEYRNLYNTATNNGTNTQIKTALKMYINELETLYTGL